MTVEATVAACRKLLQTSYRRFFRDMEIDPETGTILRRADLKERFATYPYIGSKYGSRPDLRKLLVVGLDIGSDETPGRLQHFEERRQAIELKPLPEHNPHIAGTYFTALKYACISEEWARIRDREKTCQAILKGDYALRSNPLSYIALTNFYKWVTKGRQNKGGRQDRAHVDRRRETDLFVEEVRLLAPDIVVFQGAAFASSDKPRFRQVRHTVGQLGVEWHVLAHPSEPGRRRPKDITTPRLSSTSE